MELPLPEKMWRLRKGKHKWQTMKIIVKIMIFYLTGSNMTGKIKIY